jgi:hypothetical protein
VAQHLPPNDAANSDEQYGERHVNPFVHGGSMSRIRQKSSNLRCRSGRAVPSALPERRVDDGVALWGRPHQPIHSALGNRLNRPKLAA